MEIHSFKKVKGRCDLFLNVLSIFFPVWGYILKAEKSQAFLTNLNFFALDEVNLHLIL